jgi:ribosomal-protein-alanine N-acetyltransferase
VTSIRPATAADAATLRAIELASFSDPWTEEAFRSILAHPQMRIRVAERDGAVVGFSIAWIVADEAELANLAVRPEARRAGIGAALLDELLAAVDAAGPGTIFLEVREGNEAAIALYMARGFATAGRRKSYYRAPVEDALIMRRDPAPDVSRPR